ncbi:MAG: hypothetical protein M1401_05165 [Chloroflexi bacterium]|nr:hypothetical protein [Chloroflexota bacterium]
MWRIGRIFRLEAGLRLGSAVRVGERELEPIAFRLAAQWRAPRAAIAGGYTWLYPVAVRVREGQTASTLLIPDITRLTLLACAILTVLFRRQDAIVRGGRQ